MSAEAAPSRRVFRAPEAGRGRLTPGRLGDDMGGPGSCALLDSARNLGLALGPLLLASAALGYRALRLPSRNDRDRKPELLDAVGQVPAQPV